MRNAIRHGATQDEIMEVLEIVSVIGIHGALIRAPVLEENTNPLNRGQKLAG